MEHETERTGLVATVNPLRLPELALDPFDEIPRRKPLCGLRRRVFDDAHDHDAVGVHVQTELDELILVARDLLRAGVGFRLVAFHCSLVGVASRRSPANYSCHLHDAGAKSGASLKTRSVLEWGAAAPLSH